MTDDMPRRNFLLSATIGSVLNAGQDPFSAAVTPGFGPDGKKILEKVLAGKAYRGHIPAADVKALMAAEHVSREGLMLKLIPVAKSFAHPPVSHYFVGAVVLGNSGSLCLGCNIEVPPNTLSMSVHAEQSAVANAYMSGEEGVQALTVGAAPCGHCRQFLSEVSLDVSMRLIMRDESSIKLSELLPQSFGPKNLGLHRGSFPAGHAPLALASPSNDSLVSEALKAACAAYSPYSRSPSGVAVSTAAGRVFSGSYIENAAFNPSLPPLQTALAGYFAAGGHAGEIERAVLVEPEQSAITQEPGARYVLAAVAPKVRLERYTLSAV
jgi:cytidine deaminase